MSLLELVSRLAESITNAAARAPEAHAEGFRNACDAVTTWIVQSFQAGSLTLLEVADHAARWEVITNWMAGQVAQSKMTLLEVARLTADYIAYFSG